MAILDRFRKKEDEKKQQAVQSSAAKKAEKQAVKAEKKSAKGKKAAASQKQVAPVAGSAVILHPVITEKSTVTGTYIFAVAPSANKTEVKKEVTRLYGVTPKNVRVMNVKGKSVRWGTREGKRKDWKKAVVRLAQGETIDVYQGT